MSSTIPPVDPTEREAAHILGMSVDEHLFQASYRLARVDSDLDLLRALVHAQLATAKAIRGGQKDPFQTVRAADGTYIPKRLED